MNQTQVTANKWYKIWAYLKSIGCEDQLGLDQVDQATTFIAKLKSAAEEHGVAALQSGEAPSQHLKQGSSSATISFRP